VACNSAMTGRVRWRDCFDVSTALWSTVLPLFVSTVLYSISADRSIRAIDTSGAISWQILDAHRFVGRVCLLLWKNLQ
jgi:hypothetical protein